MLVSYPADRSDLYPLATPTAAGHWPQTATEQEIDRALQSAWAQVQRGEWIPAEQVEWRLAQRFDLP